MQRWHCVQTLPHAERIACENLKRQDREFWLPVIDKGLDEKNQPLFPGYLFVRFDRAMPWQAILSTRGVRSILGLVGDVPNPLPNGCVEELQDRAQRGEFTMGYKTAPIIRYASGELVRVVDGPWWSHQGLVDKTDCDESLMDKTDRERVWILLNVCNRQTRVPVKREHVERAA